MESNLKYLETDYINDDRLAILSDGKLSTEDGHVFDIHKILLAKRSEYFNALFCGTWKHENIVLIPGMKGNILREILLFIYTDNISFRDENVSELMIAADFLLLDDLLLRLEIALKKKLTTENCVSFYVAALRIQRQDVLRDCYRFFQTHFESVVHCNSAEFGQLPLESLKDFLRDRNLCVSSEKTVFIAIVKWVMRDKFNRQRFATDLLACLAPADVDEDLASMIMTDDLVINNPFCQYIIDTKEAFASADNLEILQSCLSDSSRVAVTNFNHRLPTKLHCVVSYSACDTGQIAQLHVTYDENIDLWRKVQELEFVPRFLICVDDFIYLFRRGDNRNFRYSIAEDQWYELIDFIHPRRQYLIAVVDGRLYALGGISDITGEEIYDVELYNPEYNVWHVCPPMIPISAFCAVSLHKSIYVVGCRSFFGGYEMVAQVYHTTSETWSLLPPVSVERSHFALVAYREKVYAIAGIRDAEYLKDVEMYDPEKNYWTAKPHIPYVYIAPKAIVLNDVLIVHDNHRKDRKYMKTNPPVFWNTHNENWEQFDESSPMNKLYLYQFFTIDDRESIASVTIANRKPGACFEKSPFA